jgi:hypothetical protein
MIVYIQLEDKLISLFGAVQVSDSDNDKDGYYEKLTEEFKKYWTDYQDTWSDEYWKIYNKHRDSNDNLNSLTTSESTIEEDFEKLKKQRRVANKIGSEEQDDVDLFMNSLFLKKIDDEIDKNQENRLVKEKKDEKKRGCVDCIVF